MSSTPWIGLCETPAKTKCYSVCAVVVLILVSLLVSGVLAFSTASNGDHMRLPKRSTIDPKTFVLENGLRVVLLRDPEAELAGAGMSINAGSNDNTVLGLAHFVEHLLFISSEKYPVPGYFMSVVNQNGGGTNAFTSSEETNFFFSVKPSALEETLDVFSGFFVCPSFPEERVVDEVKAVNSEHQKNLLDDEWRRMRLIETVANPEHPFSRFSTGDSETLGGEKDLGTLAKAFKEKFYIAENMKLVIYGNFTNLEDTVKGLFNGVKSGLSSSSPRPVPFLTTGKLVVASGIAEGHSLLLVWTLPSQYDYIETQPLNLLGYMLNSNGETGLSKKLLSAGFIFKLEAGILDNFKDFSLFQIDLTLTDSGLEHWEECLDMVEAYLRGLLELTESQVGEVWRHFQMVKSVEFDYETDVSVLGLVMQTASNLQHFPPAEAYAGFVLQRTFSYSAFREHLEGMTRDRIISVLMSKGLKENSLFMGDVLSLPETEKFYGIRYEVFNISKPDIEETAGGLKFPTSVYTGLDDVQLQTCPECKSTPETLVQTDALELWYQVSLHIVR